MTYEKLPRVWTTFGKRCIFLVISSLLSASKLLPPPSALWPSLSLLLRCPPAVFFCLPTSPSEACLPASLCLTLLSPLLLTHGSPVTLRMEGLQEKDSPCAGAGSGPAISSPPRALLITPWDHTVDMHDVGLRGPQGETNDTSAWRRSRYYELWDIWRRHK